MENIIENNKIIAEFLDWEFDDLSETFETPFLKLVEPQAFGDEQFSCKLQDFELEFHSDWNWLMSVVEKIENQYRSKFSKNTFPCVSISSICCKISFYGNYEEVIANIVRPTKIEAVYDSCIEFIKWYNEQNKNNESL